jgi:hypothetical protein
VKIARIDTHSVKVPYTFGGSHKGEGLRTWTTNNILLVRVETDNGIVGWGEAFCYACTDAVRAAVANMIAPIAIGQDARDIAKLSYDLQQKLRYSWTDGPLHWDVDFFKTDDNRTYFTQAEVEMPEQQSEPPPLPPSLANHLLATAPAGDPRFASKRLANQAHAEKLLADIKSKGRIE